MKDKKAYHKSKKAHLRELDKRIDQLESKAEKVGNYEKIKYYELVEDLRAKQGAARQKLQELKNLKDDEPWDHLESAIEFHWIDLKNAIDHAIEKIISRS